VGFANDPKPPANDADFIRPKSLPGPSFFQDPGCSYRHLVQLLAMPEPSAMANRSPLLDFVVVVVATDIATQEVDPALTGDFVADARTWGS
jgi:hypothetical protein